MKNKIQGLIKDKEKCLLIFVFLLAFFVRIIAIDKFPIGLNCDEASSGYEAYSILHYGIDRNGNFLPVFLESWGSGQNALYSYILMPFIAILGLNIISTRLPMALIGCVSLIIWYKLISEVNKDKKFSFIGLVFLCICPWHIMKSRWGLESNIFPDLVLWAIYFIIKYLKTKKQSKLYIAFAILGLTGYSYGTSYFFLPIFCLGLYIYLFKTKQISIKEILISFGIIFIIALPIMLYVIINTFGLEQINLPFMTIPKLGMNRYEEQTTLFSGNVLYNIFNNFKNSISLIFVQDDGLAWNNISGIGMYYIISIPFLILGIIFSFKKNKYKFELDNILNIWFISAFLLLFVFVDANINRINILIFPLIYYIVKGIYIIEESIKDKKIFFFFIIIYLMYFNIFIFKYINITSDSYWTFKNDIEDVIEYVDSYENVENIYFEYNFKEPYIYVLFYTHADVNNYLNTVEYFNENGTFENVAGFGKYHFIENNNIEKNRNNLYVLSKNCGLDLDSEEWEVKEINEYLVVRFK